MNKYFLILVFHIFLFLSKETFAGNYFDIEAVSDSIVGKLWKEAEVPTENIKELFNLYEEDDQKKSQVQHPDKVKLDQFINEWEAAIIYASEQEKPSENLNYGYIKDFVKKIHSLESQFSYQTIKKSLTNILGKY